jgi:hypothetical protein
LLIFMHEAPAQKTLISTVLKLGPSSD